MMERGGTHGIQGTHWGAIAFTLVTAALVGTLSSAALRDAFASAPRIVSEERAERTATPTAAPSATAPKPEQVNAALVSKTAPPVIFSGTVATVVYIFRNTGSA
ncbi:MAG TPA: hypothetical protein VNC82_06415, partial [Candidatus Limnocylindria bacterium]|nr:hypothetical protein [Candidatus Limnocylindria bacterium]